MSQPVTPYPEPGGRRFTSGHSGSSTSRDRATWEDASGVTSARQRETMEYARAMMRRGITVAEVRRYKGWHHGQASSALSVLHKEGHLVRLEERRNRCQVYVLPEYVDGREEARPRKRKEDPEALYRAFEAGFRVGCDEGEEWTEEAIRMMFERWHD